MTKQNLQLNENKTEVILLGPASTNNSIKTQLGFLSNNLHNHLGVHLDPLLQFDKHVNAVVKSSFFHLRSVAKGKQFLSSKDLEIVIQTLICHSLSPSALCFPAHIWFSCPSFLSSLIY